MPFHLRARIFSDCAGNRVVHAANCSVPIQPGCLLSDPCYAAFRTWPLSRHALAAMRIARSLVMEAQYEDPRQTGNEGNVLFDGNIPREELLEVTCLLLFGQHVILARKKIIESAQKN